MDNTESRTLNRAIRTLSELTTSRVQNTDRYSSTDFALVGGQVKFCYLLVGEIPVPESKTFDGSPRNRLVTEQREYGKRIQ